MSGIYIPGISKPENCSECDKIFRFCQTEEDGSVWCFIAKGYLGEESTKCPLVPVPEHGGLIDKGTICNECRRIAEEYDGIYPDCTYCPVHHSPTIIPASKEEK